MQPAMKFCGKKLGLTLCILIDFPIHIGTISMGLPIVYFKGHRLNFLNYGVFLSPKAVLILFLANSAGPDKVTHYAAFTVCQSTCLWVSSIQSGKYMPVHVYHGIWYIEFGH